MSDPAEGLTPLKHIGGPVFRRIRDDEELGEEVVFELDEPGRVVRMKQHLSYVGEGAPKIQANGCVTCHVGAAMGGAHGDDTEASRIVATGARERACSSSLRALSAVTTAFGIHQERLALESKGPAQGLIGLARSPRSKDERG
jgi:hypothetical protein